MSAFTLRPATSEDEPFLRALFRSTREALFAAMPCDESMRAALCDMQFRAQSASYRAAYPNAQSLVICTSDGEPTGRLMRAFHDGALVLVDIALTPEFRARGIGTSIIRGLQAEAQSCGVALALSVEITSPAMRLYRRMGFEVVGDDGMRIRMQWQSMAQLEKGRQEWIHTSVR